MNMLIGIALAGVTGYTLLEQVFLGRETFGPGHAMTLATMAALLGGLHAIDGKSKGKDFVLAAFSFLCASYLIIAAGARNAENKDGPLRDIEYRRHQLEQQIQSARVELTSAREARQAECKSGEGPKCRTARDTEAQQASVFARLTTQLAEMPAPKSSADSYHSVAMLLRPEDPTKVQNYLALAMPYLQVVLCELGAALFLFQGLSKRHPPAVAQPKKKRRRKKVLRRPPPRSGPQAVVLNLKRTA